jgi:hypothetical protein
MTTRAVAAYYGIPRAAAEALLRDLWLDGRLERMPGWFGSKWRAI